MMDNLIIDLPEIRLPRDLAWEKQFVAAVREHARQLGMMGRFQAPRFFGYFFSGAHPVVVAGPWTVMLDNVPLLRRLRVLIDRVTDGRYGVVTEVEGGAPEFLIVHDRRDGTCWLWDYAHGLHFLEAREPAVMPSATGDADEAFGEDGTDSIGRE